jgi:hypothetical protein
MRRIAIFTEGQSELIFVRNFLLRIIDNARLSFDCLKLHRARESHTPYSYASVCPSVYFLIVNVENDSKVLTAIKEREKILFKKGFEKIIGLRDMYCEVYDKWSQGAINDNISRQIIREVNAEIRRMSKPNKILMCFSIMELEAWFLSMFNVFSKINPRLSVDYILTNLGFNLRTIDPQKQFYRPSVELGRVLALCEMRYSKSLADIEKITSKMDTIDFDIAIGNGRCESFKIFCEEIRAYNN